ncbi:MAG: hypothetical protein QM778_09550 [Myxococcales bacterium]
MKPALLFVILSVLSVASVAHGQVLQAPIAGRPIPLGNAGVACAAATGGWSTEPGSRMVRPPVDPQSVGTSVDLKVAATLARCPTSTALVTLVATARWPSFETSNVWFYPDEGRLDAEGHGLLGVSIRLRGADPGLPGDACRVVTPSERLEQCSWAVGRDAAADPSAVAFTWLPGGARSDPNAVTFDASGRRADGEVFSLSPARVTIARVFPQGATVDLATGVGEVPLVHPDAVAAAECSPLPCEFANKTLTVRGATNLVSALDVRVRLRPHVFLQHNEAVESVTSARLSVLHCPMSIVSGAPVRDNDDAKMVVKVEGRCARDLSSLRFFRDQTPLKILRSVNDQDASYVLLRLGDIDDDVVRITAFRGDRDAIALAVAQAATRAAPQVRATLELPGYPNLSFIPNNRPAFVHASSAGEHQRFAILPIDGIYTVSYDSQGRASVRANPNAAGLSELRFGLRTEGLPAGLDDVDLAVVRDPLQRGTAEANIPAPIDVEPSVRPPLIEVLCGGGAMPLHSLIPGVTAHLSFDLRDTCRVVFHRERLSSEYGTQSLNFEIDVIRSDGSVRGDSHVSEVISFRAGSEPRFAFIRGIRDPFDRLQVRVSHVADENHYIGASEVRTGAPAAQWSAVMGTGRLRLYGTTTIPTGLYRFGDPSHSGVLSLNFGVLSRLTWLDQDGKEGFLGAEMGLLVAGLANSRSETGQSLQQVGAVIGLGVSVPIANRSAVTQASINVHAWFETDLSRNVDTASERFAFVFGPSITIGNVGANL